MISNFKFTFSRINLLPITMQTGKVKFFNESKGFGFIVNDETGKDIFVHATGLKSEGLKEGDHVSYVEEDGRKGKLAIDVVIIEN